MAAVSPTPTSSDPSVSPLLSGYRWASSDLSYSFPATSAAYEPNYGSGEPTNNFAPLNSTQEQAARHAFANYAAVANLTFTEVPLSTATIRLAMSDRPPTAWAYFPSTAPEGGDAWFNRSSSYYSNPVKGNYAFATFLHEIGHALGLDHPHENGMPAASDTMEYTVMSYRSYSGAPLTGYVNETWGYAQSLMMYDIAALQHMYGANFTTNDDNTRYRWSPSTGEMSINGADQGQPGANRIFTTVWDGGGTDTYDFSNYTTSLNVDLRPGEWTTTSASQLARLHYNGGEIARGNIANALQYGTDPRSLIENAEGGSANDVLTGNAARNALYGNAGDDRLFGGSGNDRLLGGDGADLLDGGTGTDVAYYASAVAGIIADLQLPQYNTGEAAGDVFRSIEGLIGSRFDDNLRGDDSANPINGAGGSDVLYGRGGNDKLTGADGNDRLLGGVGADRLDGGSGTDGAYYSSAATTDPSRATGLRIDLVYSELNTGEAAGDSFFAIENLSGSRYADNLRGDNADNSVYGQDGNDTLYGRAGNDRLIGGDGNDALVGNSGADVLFGEDGSDRFVFRSAAESSPTAGDTIADFARGHDHIDLRQIDANTTGSGDQAFSYIGDASLTGKAGELNFRDGIVSGDVDGDGLADLHIAMTRIKVLSSGDFIL